MRWTQSSVGIREKRATQEDRIGGDVEVQGNGQASAEHPGELMQWPISYPEHMSEGRNPNAPRQMSGHDVTKPIISIPLTSPAGEGRKQTVSITKGPPLD